MNPDPMIDPLRIRPMAEIDIETVQAITAQSAHAPHWDIWAYRVAVMRAQSNDGFALLAENHGQLIAGFVIGGIIPPEAEIESILVIPSMQRRGIARRLMAAAIQHARDRACTRMLLEVRESNTPARALYASLGFTETGHRPAYYRDPVEAAILMELRF